MNFIRWLDRILGIAFRSICFGATIILTPFILVIACFWIYSIVAAPQHITFPFLSVQMLFTSASDGTFKVSIVGDFLVTLVYPTLLFAPFWFVMEWYTQRRLGFV